MVTLLGKLKGVVEKLKAGGIKVSLFIDPEEAQIFAAKECNADIVEIHTGAYSDSRTDAVREEELKKVIHAATKAKEQGFVVNAGHGLHYDNVREIAAIREIDELSIGHSIIARAVFVGLDRAVRDMIALMQ